MDLSILCDKINTLHRQESTVYKCQPYLSPEFQQLRQEDTVFNSTFHSCVTQDGDSSSVSGRINECWREKICEWAYQVIDHFDFNREVVAVSLSYLDRFLCVRHVNKKVFQLAAMTSLYMAIKLYEPSSLRISSFIELSRGYFTVQHIIAMEENILRDLSWYMHPPTAINFVKHYLLFLDLCNISLSPTCKHDVGELARFLCELSVCDYFFVTKKPSSIALASLLTAMDNIDQSRLPYHTKSRFFATIQELTKIDLQSSEIRECRARLDEMYRQGSYGRAHEDLMEERGASPNFVGDVPKYIGTK